METSNLAGAAMALAALLSSRSRAAAAAAAAVAPPAHAPMDPNLPVDGNGRVYHLQITSEEVAPRILSVGDAGRAERISALFDAGSKRIKVVSTRGFVTYTGFYKGVRVSIIATGMGVAMIDFVVREARAMITGPMAILRYGTCGGLGASPAGSIAVASEGAILIRRDPDMCAVPLDTALSAQRSVGGPLIAPTPQLPYSVSQVVKPHAGLAAAYASALEKHVTGALGPQHPVVRGVNATATGFYDTQGRTITAFPGDRNAGLLEAVEAAVPNVVSLEMETYTLLETAASADRSAAPIAACGAAMVVWNRHTKQSISHDDLPVMEVAGGRAALETLIAFPLEAL